MLKYLSKFAMDILPSVAATIIGAYIVNHYINKPGTGAPVAAAVSTAQPKSDANVSKPAETSSDVANIPEAGVKAKGISEKAVIDKSAADKPAETASIPAETRRHQPTPREKSVAKATPAPAQPSTVQPVAGQPSASVPVVAALPTAAPVEAASPIEEHRDANDLARAAIERLRGTGEGSSRTPEAARAPETARIPDTPYVVSAPITSAPPIRPLPPPIMVSTPSSETLDPTVGSSQAKPPYTAARADDPSRPTPPADIPPAPASRPLDLQAAATEPPARNTTVAEDVLSAAKSVFHAVLPK
jgi:hypothetical protein